LKGETYTRIARFDPDESVEKAWKPFQYQLEKPEECAEVGLNELVYLGSNRFAAIERDDKERGLAKIKLLSSFPQPTRSSPTNSRSEKPSI
jgi:hypothetical protein